MSASSHRLLWLLAVPLVVVTVCGLLALWGIRSFVNGLVAGVKPIPAETQPQLASVSVPHWPNTLTCSADGAYLAAGAWGWGDGNTESGPSELYVVDVAQASVTATLQATGVSPVLAFSPDGKWLAVATTQSILHPYTAQPAADEKEKPPPTEGPAELVVFAVPAFTARFTAKASKPANGFLDIAWAADSQALYALDGLRDAGEVRRWDVPAFTEQPAILAPQMGQYPAIAVSPDGRTLAVSQNNPRLIQLFDVAKGTEQSRFAVEPSDGAAARLGFTPDGKAVGVLEGSNLLWRDAATGRSVKPNPAGFAIQPAGLYDFHHAISPDGGKQAWGLKVNRDFGDLGWDNRQNEYGSFVRMTLSATEKTWTWRVGDSGDVPAVVFFPDGTKLAGAVKEPSGASIQVWATPK